MSQPKVLLSTTQTIPGYRLIQNRGLVFGVTVRSRGMGGECAAGCQTTCGGEVTAYTDVIIDARNQAIGRMIQEALSRGANAIVGIHFDSDQLGEGANNAVVAVGTAVVVEPLN